jgi:hypothetical protein
MIVKRLNDSSGRSVKADYYDMPGKLKIGYPDGRSFPKATGSRETTTDRL